MSPQALTTPIHRDGYTLMMQPYMECGEPTPGMAITVIVSAAKLRELSFLERDDAEARMKNEIVKAIDGMATFIREYVPGGQHP